MQHYDDLNSIQIEKSWCAIGTFDGVHIGHQMVFRRLVAGAQNSHAASVVITFHPHPAIVLGKISQTSYLTTPEERADLIGQLGVDVVISLTFTRQTALMTAADFMQMLTERLGIRHMIAGQDFALGRGREGDVSRLKELGKQMRFDIEIIDPVNNGSGKPISSSLIRQLIVEGQLQEAASLLGRYYRTDGKVIHGDNRGKLLGFPTANLEHWAERLMPPAGVYATWIWIDGVRYPSVSNLGVRPTFENQAISPQLEVHILDWRQDLYGQVVQLDFVERLRQEIRFPSSDALIDQIKMDIQTAREVLTRVA
jgi:riboflavin kinase/FMN adenylyltransferase